MQYLLQSVYKNKRMSAPTAELVVDGICGHVTRSWIHKFQMDTWYDEKAIYQDGIVCPVIGNNIYSSDSKTIHMILFLNAALKKDDMKAYLSLAQPSSVPRLSCDWQLPG